MSSLPSSPPSVVEAEIDACAAEEARRAARTILPLLLLGLYFVHCVLGAANEELAVRRALLGEVAIGVVRWGVLALLAPPAGSSARPVSLARHVVNAGSSWMVSVGMANIYFAAAPFLGSVQLLELAIVATGICTLTMMSMSSAVTIYVGYIVINYGALALVMLRHGDRSIVPLAPTMMGLFTGVLTLLALKNRAVQRAKTKLSIELRESGLRDALTGLRNRAFAIEFAERRTLQIVEQWKGGVAPTLAFFLIDLDHFKSINDRHGHGSGDEVLASFAKLAKASVRSQDVVARWGGEEFLVVMEVASRSAANVAAERLRAALAAHPIALPAGGEVTVTCSIGACLLPRHPSQPDALTWKETVELADAALYRAKHGGRNRVSWVSEHDDGTSSSSPVGIPMLAVAAAQR